MKKSKTVTTRKDETGSYPSKLSKEDQELLDLALRRHKAATEAYSRQSEQEVEDLHFQDPDSQWDEGARRSRQGAMATNVPMPARPIVSVDKLSAPIQNVLNQARNAHLGINIHPLSPDATDDTARIEQGLYRKIERDSHAYQARLWGLDRSSKCGRGWYRINTCYDEAGGHPFDQVITIEPILYQANVRIDPAAQKPDFSDANYGFIDSWVSCDEFKRLWPDAEIDSSNDFEAWLESTPDWVKLDGDHKAILVTEYWYKEWEKKKYIALADGRCVPEDELEEGDEPDPEQEPRLKDECTVWYCKLAGGPQILEKQEWNGRYIPLIPVIGRELQPFDERRRWVGIIGPAKDAQRGFNWAISTATERAALEPKAPYIGYDKVFAGYEGFWDHANDKNFSRLPVKVVPAPGQQGGILPLPQRNPVDAQTLSISLSLAEAYDQAIQATTQAFDPSLGQGQTAAQSGRAIQGLQGQSDLGNSHYIANLATISMPYEACVILDMIPRVYDRPGRLAHILDEKDESELVMLNAPHIQHPQTQRLERVIPHPQVERQYQLPAGPGRPMPTPIPPQSQAQGAPPVPVKHYDLREGSYGVEVTVGKSWQSRLDQGDEFLSAMVKADPELMQVAGDLVFKYKDFPGASDVSDRLLKLIQMKYPKIFDKPGDPADPAALQAQLMQAENQIKQLTAQLQQLVTEKQTEAVKHGAMLQREQIKTASDERIAEANREMDLLIEKVRMIGKMTDAGLAHGHEQGLAARQAAHEVALASSTASKDAIHAQVPPPAPPAPAAGVPPFTASNPQEIPPAEGGV